jgi:hypothetical protein
VGEVLNFLMLQQVVHIVTAGIEPIKGQFKLPLSNGDFNPRNPV